VAEGTKVRRLAPRQAPSNDSIRLPPLNLATNSCRFKGKTADNLATALSISKNNFPIEQFSCGLLRPVLRFGNLRQKGQTAHLHFCRRIPYLTTHKRVSKFLQARTTLQDLQHFRRRDWNNFYSSFRASICVGAKPVFLFDQPLHFD